MSFKYYEESFNPSKMYFFIRHSNLQNCFYVNLSWSPCDMYFPVSFFMQGFEDVILNFSICTYDRLVTLLFYQIIYYNYIHIYVTVQYTNLLVGKQWIWTLILIYAMHQTSLINLMLWILKLFCKNFWELLTKWIRFFKPSLYKIKLQKTDDHGSINPYVHCILNEMTISFEKSIFWKDDRVKFL